MVKKKILVVEDNELNLKLFGYVLRSPEVDVMVARTGEEALAMIASERPDLVVLDIQLPGMNGMDVTKQVKQDPRLTHTIIVAVTALAMAGDRERALNAGCNYYLPKPIDTRTFRQTILAILREDTTLMAGEVPAGR